MKIDPKIMLAVAMFLVSIAIWAAFIATGKADPAPFVGLIQLVAGGAWTAIFALIDPKKQAESQPQTTV